MIICFKNIIYKLITSYHLILLLGIGDWGLGIGDWGLGTITNAQKPKPKTQTTITIK